MSFHQHDFQRMQSVLFNPAAAGGKKVKTRIVCTIGPKSNSVEKMCELLDAGMCVVRMNTAHGDFDYHQSIIDNCKAACAKKKTFCALLLDTKGPEIRTGKLQENPARDGKKEWSIEKGQTFTFTTDRTFLGNNTKVSVTWANLPKVVVPGKTRILVADGLLGFLAKSTNGVDEVQCVAENAGSFGENKNVNVPGVVVDLPAVTEKDKAFIAFGVKNNIDYIAASFIRKAQDIREVRAEPGVKENDIKIVSKIESQEGIDNFDEILAETDGVMVARGDLGVEIPLEKVATSQKMMIAKCNAVGKMVITATQMLESMLVNPRPTRAEVTDVFNAVLDGTDCVMLSGETANGNYPVEAVRTMSNICREAESGIDYRELFLKTRATVKPPVPIPDSIASSAVKTAWDLEAAVIICFSESGRTARFVAKYRPHCPVVTVTAKLVVANQLLGVRGCYPYLIDIKQFENPDVLIQKTINKAKFDGFVSSGDLVVVVSGAIHGIASSLRVISVEDI